MPRARLVTLPADDLVFAEDCRDLMARVPQDLPDRDVLHWLQRELRSRYPTAVVRPQEELARPHPDAPRIWYAVRTAHRARIDAKLLVPVPPEVAFRLYVERLVEWQTVVELRPLRTSPAIVGDEYEATYRLLGRPLRGHLRILAAEPVRFIATEAGGSGVRVAYVTRFDPVPDGTLVAVEGDYELPSEVVPRIVDRLVIERAISRDIDAAHASFAALCARTVRAGRKAGPSRGRDRSSPAGRQPPPVPRRPSEQQPPPVPRRRSEQQPPAGPAKRSGAA